MCFGFFLIRMFTQALVLCYDKKYVYKKDICGGMSGYKGRRYIG